MTRPRAWNDAVRVLCVRLDSLGDVLMTTPALRALKLSHPARLIALLTSPAGAVIARAVPEIDEVIVYEAPWMKATPGRADTSADLAMIERVRRMNFDTAVIFTVYSQSSLPAAFFCQLAGIPLRLAHCRENPYLLLSDWIAEPEPHNGIRHEVRRQLDLVASVGCTTSDERLSLRVSPVADGIVKARLRELGITRDAGWVLIHPGASAPSRRYPPEGFAKAADLLTRDYGLRVIFSGSESERALVAGIRERMAESSDSLAGDLAIADFSALVRRAPVLISNNTGPVHIAAALGTPVVDLYAQTNPQHTPWGVRCRVLFHEVPCKYCYKSICPEEHHDCLRRVSPESVATAAWELLSERDHDGRESGVRVQESGI